MKQWMILTVLIILTLGLLIFNEREVVVKPSSDAFGEVRLLHEQLVADTSLARATFSGGCFWCMEGPFEALNGVREVLSGYAGGILPSPTYEQVLSDETGHRESVQIYYDPSVVSFGELLKTYWMWIDPTDDGGQFADRGFHYTTAIFYHSEEEKLEAERQIQDLNKSGRINKPVVTQVLPFSTFYPAEDYHQDFYKKSAEYYSRYVQGSGRKDYADAAKRW